MAVRAAHICELGRTNVSRVEKIPLLFNVPEPFAGERPTIYADRVGEWYSANVSSAHKKMFGQYLTPVAVSDFMAGLLTARKPTIRIIDPGAGAGILSCAACEFLALQKNKPTHIFLDAFETDCGLLKALGKTLPHLARHLYENGVKLSFTINCEDFILKFAHALGKTPVFFDVNKKDTLFDICISNPPYFKLPKSDPRAKAAADVVHGQPNIYALFMAVGASVLSKNGELIFITPRSFTSGPYFQLFRQRFFEKMRPELIHIFDSRREAFGRDSILQENIIIKARRDDDWESRDTTRSVLISESSGAEDIKRAKSKRIPLSAVLDLEAREKVLRIYNVNQDEIMFEKMSSWSGSLYDYGLEISTGPVVPFRASRFISEKEEAGRFYAPLLWLQNVHPMRITWPVTARRKPQHIEVSDGSMRLLVPVRNYVLLRRFSAKEEVRRLTAAPFIAGKSSCEWIGLENHLNYIYRAGSTLSAEEAWGLAVLYNSSFFNAYFRTLNGSTQVSATEIRTIALPPLSIICTIGRKAMACSNILENIDSLAFLAFQENRTKTRNPINAK